MEENNKINNIFNNLEIKPTKIQRTLSLKNTEGKRLIQLSKLEYCNKIINNLKQNPDMIDSILREIEMSEKEFFSILSGEKIENIVVYDFILEYSKELLNKKFK